MAEPPAKSAGEIRIVGKAAGIGDLAERLACAQQLPAMHKARGVIQTNRLYEMAAGRVVRGEELLQVAQRDPCFGRYLAGTERRIGIMILDDVADALEQFFRLKREHRSIRRREERAQQIIDRQVQIGIVRPFGCAQVRRGQRIVVLRAIENDLVEHAPCGCSGTAAKATLRLEPEMGHEGPARQLQRQPCSLPSLPSLA